MRIYQEWLEAKEAERVAVARRRDIEDTLNKSLPMPDAGKSATIKEGGYKIKVTTRLNRKIDGDLAQEIAAEHGIMDHLRHLFRWKPELNQREWDSADSSITEPLNAAITTTPGRPSFTIEKDEEQ